MSENNTRQIDETPTAIGAPQTPRLAFGGGMNMITENIGNAPAPCQPDRDLDLRKVGIVALLTAVEVFYPENFADTADFRDTVAISEDGLSCDGRGFSGAAVALMARLTKTVESEAEKRLLDIARQMPNGVADLAPEPKTLDPDAPFPVEVLPPVTREVENRTARLHGVPSELPRLAALDSDRGGVQTDALTESASTASKSVEDTFNTLSSGASRHDFSKIENIQDDEIIEEATRLFGVREILQLFAYGGVISAGQNIAPFNVVVSGDDRGWTDNGSSRSGDVVDLLALAWKCTRHDAARNIIEVMASMPPEYVASLRPLFENGVDSDHPEFPADCLPHLLKDMGDAIVAMEGVPTVLAAGVVIASVSACLGSGVVIETKHDKHSCGNLYLLMEATSGSGKTGAFERAKSPIHAFESDLLDEQKETAPSVRARLKIVEAEIKSLTSSTKSAAGPDTFDHLVAFEKEKEHLQQSAKAHCIVSGEVTTERLSQLMAENGGAMAGLSGEARGPVQVLCGRYSDGQANDALYLSAFVVDESYRRQRVTDGDTVIARPCLTIGWLVQPDAFADMWSKRSLVTGGLLARFLSCRTHARIQHVEVERKTFPSALADQYDNTLKALLKTYRMNAEKPFVVEATTEARKIIVDYTNRIADRADAGEFSQDATPFAARWGEISWKLALVFHAAEHGASAHTLALSELTARCAVGVVSWFALQQLELVEKQAEVSANDRTLRIMKLVARLGRITARLAVKDGICVESREAKTLLDDLVKDGLLASRDHRGRGTPTRYYSRPAPDQPSRF